MQLTELNYILHLYYTFFQYVQTCMNDCLTLGNIYSYAFLICVIVFVSFELIVVFTGKSSDWVIIIYTKSISAEGLCLKNHKLAVKSRDDCEL